MENQQDNRDFKGIWIPRDIWLDPDLTPNEKILLAEIDSLSKGDGCFASNQYLADFMKMKQGSLKNLLTKLRKKRLISTQYVGRRRHLRLVRGHLKMTPGIIQKLPETSSRNDPYNKEYNKVEDTSFNGSQGNQDNSQNIDGNTPQLVVDYFNQVTGQNRNLTPRVEKLIKGRIADGEEIDGERQPIGNDQFKVVIRHKVEQWSWDDEMSKYLTPETLFKRMHFLDYLQDAREEYRRGTSQMTMKQWLEGD